MRQEGKSFKRIGGGATHSTPPTFQSHKEPGTSSPILKFCKVCAISKPLEDFHRQSKAKDGRRTYCKACRREDRLVPKERSQKFSKETHSVKEGFLPQACLKLCEMDEPVLTVTDNAASNTKTSAAGGELRPMAHDSLLLALAQKFQPLRASE